MNRRRRRAALTTLPSVLVLAMVALALVAAFGACTEARLNTGERCERNSECAAPLVCRLDRCRRECNTTRDCAVGYACVLDASGLGACQGPEDKRCTRSSDCAAPLVCRFEQCVNECTEDRDCPAGSHCMTDASGGRACIDTSGKPCVHHEECSGSGQTCALDGRCRDECVNDRDCRYGTTCCDIDKACHDEAGCMAAMPRDMGPPDTGPRDAGGTDGGGGGGDDGGRTGDGGMTDDGGPADGGPGPDGGSTVTTFEDMDGFAAATCETPTVLFFDGATELDGLAANDVSITPSYASLGVTFRPFSGTTTFPVIARGQAWQLVLPGHDGLLGNGSSPAPPTDLDGRAIRATFSPPVHAVGTSVNVGDGGRIEAYDAMDRLIGSADIASGGFGGLTMDAPIITRVVVLNTFDADANFGIYAFQFAACP